MEVEDNIFKNKTIEELMDEGLIDVRSYNILKHTLDVNNVSGIIDYFLEHKTFMRLRNAGRRTNEYLINVVQLYKQQYLESKVVCDEIKATSDENDKVKINPELLVEDLNEYAKLCNKIKRMNKLYFMKNPVDQVRVCKGNMCIEAIGDNAKLLTMGFVFMLVCVGVAVLLSKYKKKKGHCYAPFFSYIVQELFKKKPIILTCWLDINFTMTNIFIGR